MCYWIQNPRLISVTPHYLDHIGVLFEYYRTREVCGVENYMDLNLRVLTPPGTTKEFDLRGSSRTPRA
jgi:hypothetical protein